MAVRKGKDTGVNIFSITTSEEWQDLLSRKGGLTVVDVYSEWSGPCSAMVSALKKIKLEVGDDTLNYAMAKTDTIPALEIFRNHCVPTWLFIASGEPVAAMHGANAPLMKIMVAEQMENERKVLEGSQLRATIRLEDAVPVSNNLSIDHGDGPTLKHQPSDEADVEDTEAANEPTHGEDKNGNTEEIADTEAPPSSAVSVSEAKYLIVPSDVYEDNGILSLIKTHLEAKGVPELTEHTLDLDEVNVRVMSEHDLFGSSNEKFYAGFNSTEARLCQVVEIRLANSNDNAPTDDLFGDLQELFAPDRGLSLEQFCCLAEQFGASLVAQEDTTTADVHDENGNNTTGSSVEAERPPSHLLFVSQEQADGLRTLLAEADVATMPEMPKSEKIMAYLQSEEGVSDQITAEADESNEPAWDRIFPVKNLQEDLLDRIKDMVVFQMSDFTADFWGNLLSMSSDL